MNKFTSKVAAAALTLSLASVSGQAVADSSKPIVIPIHNWSSQVVMSYVIGGIFESMGNNVSYVPADSSGVYESIRLGDVTISHEVWEGAFGNAYYTAMEKGGLIEAGTHSALTIEDMGVPNFVIEQNLCPGLPNWEALKGCGSVFATADSGGKGVFLDGPWHVDAETGKNLFEDRIGALGLDDEYTYKQTGSADALWAAIDAAEAANEGIIIFNWTPNFTDSDGFYFIEFPPYFYGCRETEGGDGACGSPRGWLKKAANYKFPKTHPRCV
jgi:glycine betaine/proline transport system substrate-binding protein